MFKMELEFIAKVTLASLRNTMMSVFNEDIHGLPTSDVKITIEVTLPSIPTQELLASYETAILEAYRESNELYAYSVKFKGYKSIEQTST